MSSTRAIDAEEGVWDTRWDVGEGVQESCVKADYPM